MASRTNEFNLGVETKTLVKFYSKEDWGVSFYIDIGKFRCFFFCLTALKIFFYTKEKTKNFALIDLGKSEMYVSTWHISEFKDCFNINRLQLLFLYGKIEKIKISKKKNSFKKKKKNKFYINLNLLKLKNCPLISEFIYLTHYSLSKRLASRHYNFELSVFFSQKNLRKRREISKEEERRSLSELSK
ncbi:hypothetical protein BpHYR1_040200 [Brachionus plicatilis]|uniref:Uncharacterized protein n=1 Tax=Brachionus plicatilis TaxID=10195 RepID=A0A3M7QTS0_BRAPC|nr:hypothetical protein BpHYR1_040200 [Brachionus plicatilis]